MADEQESGHKEQPIIIKKVKKGGHGGHHGGAWKVAYADFVTAMMAFFIVMWILASSEEVKQSVTAYFQDPGAFSFITGKRTVPIDLGMVPELKKGDGDGKGKENTAFVIQFEKKTMDTIQAEALFKALNDSVSAAKRVEVVGDKLKKQIETELSKKPELEDIISSIKIEMTKEGLRIELIESTESLFFEVGSSVLRKEAVDILRKLALEIGKLPNNVEIEGHTDSRSFKSKAIYSNWELSSDRANSARRLLETAGLWNGQIVKVTGFSDRKLRNAENPFDITNRRVSILIKQLSTDQFMSIAGDKENEQ